MGTSSGKIDLETISHEKVEAFYDWLQGKSCPDGVYFAENLNLTETEAFNVIYYLQEVLGVIPDKFERCKKCGCLIDSENEGIYVCGNYVCGNYCDECRPN